VAAVSPIARPAGLAPPDTAFADLYERHAGRVFGFCLKWLRSREEAEDAAQTTFFYAWRGLGRGVVPDFESAWLLAIARNVCLSRTDAARRRSVEIAADPSVLEAAVVAPVRGDELAGLPEALASLTEQQRRAILLREWQGLTYREIADELGLSQSAVETLLFRARRTLAARLRRPLSAGSSFLPWLKSALGGGAKLGVSAIVVAATATTGAVVAAQHARHATSPRQPAAGAGAQATVAARPSAGTRHAPLQAASGAPAATVKRGRYVGPATPPPVSPEPEQPPATAAAEAPTAPAPAAPSSVAQQPATSAKAPLETAVSGATSTVGSTVDAAASVVDTATATVASTVDTAGAVVDTATATAAVVTDTAVSTVDAVVDTVGTQVSAPPAVPTVTVPTKLLP
jgi:RNA polymerase sigma factor (sigma-70 family)